MQFLQEKLDASKDMEERVGLGSLLQTISAVLDKVKQMEDEQAALSTTDQEELTLDQVKNRMKEIQAGQEAVGDDGKGKTFGAFVVKEDKRDSFNEILQRFQVHFF